MTSTSKRRATVNGSVLRDLLLEGDVFNEAESKLLFAILHYATMKGPVRGMKPEIPSDLATSISEKLAREGFAS